MYGSAFLFLSHLLLIARIPSNTRLSVSPPSSTLRRGEMHHKLPIKYNTNVLTLSVHLNKDIYSSLLSKNCHVSNIDSYTEYVYTPTHNKYNIGLHRYQNSCIPGVCLEFVRSFFSPWNECSLGWKPVASPPARAGRPHPSRSRRGGQWSFSQASDVMSYCLFNCSTCMCTERDSHDIITCFCFPTMFSGGVSRNHERTHV